MSRDSALFYSIAIPAGCIGSVVALVLGWGNSAVFAAGMGPIALVILVFMLREQKESAGSDHGVKPSPHRGS